MILTCCESGAHFKYLFWLLFLHEVAKKLLPQAQFLTASLNSIGIVVNFEEEQHIVFVNLGVEPFNELIDLIDDFLLGC